ncbi:uncharacterized protein LOC142168341 [Nicotiana tabacum]|uniref:Uncharacterized protein LOC142168341 n=1 Tax=Nicotiana tabacum TaxID=4097 RepID=A0AC58SJG4_TOBAC
MEITGKILTDNVDNLPEEHKAHAKGDMIQEGWNCVTNYRHAVNGRAWILWDNMYYAITVIQEAAQYIRCHITGRHSTDALFMTVVLSGDFNALLYPQDRQYGAPVTIVELKDFSYCIHSLFLNEIPCKGDYYTWTNKQAGDDTICSRLDRTMGNDECMLQYSHVQTEYGETFFSDHAPMILNFQSRDHNIKALFRFFNVWTDHPNFMPIIEKKWRMQTNHGRIKRIWEKLKSLRPKLRHLNNAKFKGITMKIDQATIDLK